MQDRSSSVSQGEITRIPQVWAALYGPAHPDATDLVAFIPGGKCHVIRDTRCSGPRRLVRRSRRAAADRMRQACDCTGRCERQLLLPAGGILLACHNETDAAPGRRVHGTRVCRQSGGEWCDSTRGSTTRSCSESHSRTVWRKARSSCAPVLPGKSALVHCCT